MSQVKNEQNRLTLLASVYVCVSKIFLCYIECYRCRPNLIPSLISVDSWFEVLELKFNVNPKQRLVQFLKPSREVRAALHFTKD